MQSGKPAAFDARLPIEIPNGGYWISYLLKAIIRSGNRSLRSDPIMDVTFSYWLDRRGAAVICASDSRLPIYIIDPVDDEKDEGMDEGKDDKWTTEGRSKSRQLSVIRSANALVEKLATAPPAGLPGTEQLLFFTSSRLAQARDFTDPPPISGLVRSIVAIKTLHWRIRTGPDPFDVSEFVRAYDGVVVSASSDEATHSDNWLISHLDFDRRIDLPAVAVRHAAALPRLDATLGRQFPEVFAQLRAPVLTR